LAAISNCAQQDAACTGTEHVHARSEGSDLDFKRSAARNVQHGGIASALHRLRPQRIAQPDRTPRKAELVVSESVADRYRPDIDGLRSLAVLAVVCFHAFPDQVPGGYVGVDIFFVISGFLISTLLLNDLAEHRFSIIAFYGRRIRRLFPALALCFAAVLTYGFICLVPSEFAQVGKHVFFGSAFLSNVTLWSESGYFDTAATLKPLLHLWSLGVEEQFYIAWPVTLWIAFRAKLSTAPIIGLLLSLSFITNIALSSTDGSSDFYLPFSRFWELLAGAALVRPTPLKLSLAARSLISSAGLLALLASIVAFTPDMRFPGWAALLPVSGSVAIIVAGPGSAINRSLLSHRSLVFVGLISYPLYIWHWPLISYAYVLRLGKPPTPLLAVILVVLAFVLAWATYRFVECPIRVGPNGHRRTQALAACVAILGMCGWAVWLLQGLPGRFPSLPGLDVPKIVDAKLDADFKLTRDMLLSDHGFAWITSLGHGERKVALSGDSLLFHYGPRVQQLKDEQRLRTQTYFVTGPSCPPVPKVIQKGKFERCADITDLLLELVRREKIQSVVLGASWSGYANASVERSDQILPLHTAEGFDAFYANLEDYIRLLQALGARVYLVLPSPNHRRFDPATMIERGMFGFRIAPDVNVPVKTDLFAAANATTNDRLRAISDRTGAILLDPVPDVCGGNDCSAFFEDGKPKFSDGLHLRPVFVQTHVRFLDPLLTDEPIK